MTAVLVDATDPDNGPPRIEIELSGADGGTASVVRVDAAGNSAPVRTGDPATISGGGWIGYDYEPPYNVPVIYVATTDGDEVTSAPVTLAVDRPWLIHPGIPSLSLPLEVVSRGNRTKATNRGVHAVLEREYPIVITDGIRQAPTFDLVVDTETLEDEQMLEDLLDDSETLLLQLTWPGIRRSFYGWVSIGDVDQADLSDYLGIETVRWTLPCTVTSAPAGLLQEQRTLGTLASQFATLREIKQAYDSLRDIILDEQNA